MYIKHSLEKYLNLLAARQAVPGGGSAAALVAASGAALYLMVAEYSDPTPQRKQAVRKLKLIQARMEAIVDRDAVVFTKLQDALRMPAELKQRRRFVQTGLRNAACVPLELADLCVQAMEAGAFLAERGNKNLITDAGAATLFLDSAFATAGLNVRINVKYLKQAGVARRYAARLEKLRRRMNVFKQRVLKQLRRKV